MADIGHKFPAAFLHLFQLFGHHVKGPGQLAHLVDARHLGAGVEAAPAHFLGRAGDDGQRLYDAAGVERRADDGRQRRKGKADADL